MGMTKPIPKGMNREFNRDPFFSKCCLAKAHAGPCEGRIERHHNFETYQHGNKGRLNEPWAILPVCKRHHDMARTSAVKEKLDYVMLARAPEEVFSRYDRSNLRQRWRYVSGKWESKVIVP